MGIAYTVEFPPPMDAPEAAADLGTGWRVATDMWRAHAPVVIDPAEPIEMCRVCGVRGPCAMWLWLGRFLSAAAGEPVEGRGGPLPCQPEFPDAGALRLQDAAVGRSVGRAVVPPVPVEARRQLDRRRLDLPAAYAADDRGWLG
jgi:hypothetical protein